MAPLACVPMDGCTLALPLYPGLEVEISGFFGRSDLNGARVRLAHKKVSAAGQERWSALVMDGFTSSPEVISAKPENLVRLREAGVRQRSDPASTDYERRSKRRRVEAEFQRRVDADRKARLDAATASAIAAKARERTTDLALDNLAAIFGLLNLTDVQCMLHVCKSWRDAARLTARDVAWQARRLNPHEIRQMGLPLSTKQRWLQTNPQQASMLDIRTLVSFGATRSPYCCSGWSMAGSRRGLRFNGSCVQINFDVDRMCGQSAELYAGVQAAAASLESSGDLDAGRAVATLVLCEEGVCTSGRRLHKRASAS